MAHKTPPIGATSAIEPAERARGAGPLESVERVEKTTSADAVRAPERAAAVSALGAVGQVAKAQATDRVRSIADRLRRGALTPNEAVAELIEDTVNKNLPGLPADSPLVEELRTLLASYMQDDPHLAQQVKGLGAGR